MESAVSPFETPATRLNNFFNPAQPRAIFEDSEIDEVASLLQHSGQHVASRCPRTYIVLRTIEQLSLLERLMDAGFGDQWFPVDERGHGLPPFLDPRVKARIIECQHIIMTKSVDLEQGRHRHFDLGEPLPFNIGDRLGSGGSGQVDKIVSKISFKEYALKRIHRRTAFGNKSKEAVAEIICEIDIVRKLGHRHIVEFVGSYTDTSHLGLIMAPVADCDLAYYMQQTCVNRRKCSTLRMFFGCLATALSYLHGKSIKHRDIKPQNVLVYRSNPLITDFGLSRDYLDTTSGPTLASPRYCSPEVAGHEARNMSTDIWSLGCVFLEMVAALQGYDIDWLRRRFEDSGTKSTHYHANRPATEELLEHWTVSLERKDRIPLAWVREMLLPERKARPTAARVVEMITCLEDSECSATTFCGICCAASDQANSIGSLIDNIHNESERQDQTTEVHNEPQLALESEIALHAESLPTNQAVFGVSVDVSIRYAKTEIKNLHGPGRSKHNIEGQIPIIVEKCCLYILQKGHHYFSGSVASFKNANEAKVKELQAIFDTPPSYGTDLDWTNYSASEAKAVLHAFLHSLPEPLIPSKVAQQLASVRPFLIGGDTRLDASTDINMFVEAFNKVSRPRYNLLLYLLAMFYRYTASHLFSSFKSVAKKYHSSILQLKNAKGSGYATAIDVVRFMIEFSPTFVSIEGRRQWSQRHGQ